MTIAKTSYPATQASTPASNKRDDSTTAENYCPTHQKSGNSGVHAGQNTCFWIRIEEPEGIDIDQLIISFVPLLIATEIYILGPFFIQFYPYTDSAVKSASKNPFRSVPFSPPGKPGCILRASWLQARHSIPGFILVRQSQYPISSDLSVRASGSWGEPTQGNKPADETVATQPFSDIYRTWKYQAQI